MCKAKVWTESVSIPTYEIGQAEKNPVFIEKRVYQCSSGKVYPYPVVEKISDTKIDKTYTAVYLENEYLKVMILPELGGRIQRAFDKTGHYDFVYYNEVIKPALVGLTGPGSAGESSLTGRSTIVRRRLHRRIIRSGRTAMGAARQNAVRLIRCMARRARSVSPCIRGGHILRYAASFTTVRRFRRRFCGGPTLQ